MVTEKSVLCHTQKQREPNRLPGAQRREGCAFTYAAELQSVGIVFNEASSGRDKDDRYLRVENSYRADTAGLQSELFSSDKIELAISKHMSQCSESLWGLGSSPECSLALTQEGIPACFGTQTAVSKSGLKNH